jgi:hypothetical protein
MIDGILASVQLVLDARGGIFVKRYVYDLGILSIHLGLQEGR